MRFWRLVGLLCLLAAATGVLSQADGVGAWFGYPTQNTPICTASGSQIYPQIVSDGSGGAVITWQDGRSGNYDVYAQRVDNSGAVQWTTDGMAICTAAGDQASPWITPDGSGGTVITWEDSRSGNNDIHAQRVDSGGAVQWSADGAPVCTGPGDQERPQGIPDGSGGAIITWQDDHSDNYDIYAQRVDSSGLAQWAAGGAAVCTAALSQFEPRIAPDGSGGAIIAWYDYRNGSILGADLYAQRVSSDGVVQWAADGVPVCIAAGAQAWPRIIPDGSGGAFITWSDTRAGADSDIYAQRVAGNGLVQWAADGVAICTASSSQLQPQIAPDGSGGAIIAWQDLRRASGWESDIYAQRVDPGGAVGWAADGVAVGAASFSLYEPQIAPDGSGGAIIAWSVHRSGNGHDIYAQRVSSTGAIQWAAAGVAVCTASNTQERPRMVSDASGGAIIAWSDARSDSGDVYADRLASSGILPDNHPPAVTLASTAASPTNTSPIPVTASFTEAVTGFTIDDLAVGNGAPGGFTAVSGTVYTFDVTPAGEGQVTVDVAAGAALDPAGNGNTAAARYAITYALPPPAITSFSATWGKDGDTVVIAGANFLDVSRVAFGESEAPSFTVDSASRITAVAEHGASGRISVAAARGTATSDEDYAAPDSPPPSTNWALIGSIAGIGVVLSAIVGWLVVSRRR